MYSDLETDAQLLLAIQFHLRGAAIPQELQELLGKDLVDAVVKAAG